MQVLSYRTGLVSLFLSVPVFIMEHHIYKDKCSNRAAASGEQELVFPNDHVAHALLTRYTFFPLTSVCMGGVWNCTENNCTGETRPPANAQGHTS